MTAADELRQAAETLRAAAKVATPEPWMVEQCTQLKDGCMCLSCYEPVEGQWTLTEVDSLGEDPSLVMTEGDARLMALLRDIAEPVADLLDEMSRRVYHNGVVRVTAGELFTISYRHERGIARLINGKQP